MSGPACRADGCTRPRRPRDLMCKPHWFAVPEPIRRRILAAVRPGSIRQSDEWIAAVDDAVAALKAAGR